MNRILDASLTSALLIPSQKSPGVEALVFRSPYPLVAPEILRQETHHLLLKADRRGEWPRGGLARLVEVFRSLPVRYYHDPAWVDRAFDLAQELNTGLFDTIYLVAAVDLDAELWTRDQRFAAAASRRFADQIHLV